LISENSLFSSFNLDTESAKPSRQTLKSFDFADDSNTPFALWKDKPVSRAQLYSHVETLSRRLPDGKYAINLCEDKYLFAVSFLAVLVRHQTNLLPPNQTSAVITELIGKYPSSYIISDQVESGLPVSPFIVDTLRAGIEFPHPPSIESEHLAVCAFTSGSTGNPKPNPRTWGQLKSAALLAIDRFNLTTDPQLVVSTVPTQHMYGLETSFLWPLFSSSFFHSSQPFFPEDIRQLIKSTPQPCMLISTPPHLKACVRSQLEWQNVAGILSATAPMSMALAKQVEYSFKAPLFEIFGSTETFSFASRKPARETFWQPYEKTRVVSSQDASYLEVEHFDDIKRLDDRLEIQKNGTFSVQGRSADLVKVAGKRMSLAALNQHLQQINGVEDGLYFVPENQTESSHLGALVVSRLDKSVILHQLKQLIDQVFLPRPLYHVREIPRNTLGKVNQQDLGHFLKGLSGDQNP